MNFMSSQNPSVCQNHSGTGDIVRDKYVTQYLNLLPESLQKPIDLVLSDIRERKPDKARVRLETLKATNGLAPDSEAVLDMLSIHLNLLEDSQAQGVYSSLLSTQRNTPNPLVRDLCLANLIRLDAKNNRIDDAWKRYNQADNRQRYSKETYYECVATSEELQQAYEKNRLNLDEALLIGLIRGALRTQSFDFALIVANHLNNIAPSFNSKILSLVVSACNLEKRLANKHYWLIPADLRAEVISLIEDVILLINESNGSDLRLLSIAAAYWHNIRNNHQQLDEVCKEYVEEIEKIQPQIAAYSGST